MKLILRNFALSVVALFGATLIAACSSGHGATPSFTIGGTVSGLTGTVVLHDNGGDNLSVGANGTFTFATKVVSGGAYAVTVAPQPVGQTCVVTAGSGTATANVTTVMVACTNNPYSIGGTASGLTGSMVLQDNGGDNLTVPASGPFTFAANVASGGAYAVTVLTPPVGQSCTVTSGSGIASASVTNVAVACTNLPTYSIGGTTSGLVGSVVLQDNGGNNLTVSASSAFTFTTNIISGGAYAVTVLTQPLTQTCTVASGSGTVSANVTNVAVTCVTNTYSIGGTVSGLVGSVLLQDNGGDNLTVSASGAFTFTTKINSGTSYAVAVLGQPMTQTCTVTSGAGTASANVTNVAVICVTNTYSIGGTVSGLVGSVVLQDNGGNNQSVGVSGAFAFTTRINSGMAYSVTVLTQPATQTCTVASGAGTASANVTNVTVTCVTNTYSIGGTVAGLVGSVVLQDNGGNNLTVSAGGALAFTFTTKINSGAAYVVTVLTQPATQTCTVASGSGTASANVTNVAVTCTTNTYSIGGTVSGLVGNVVLQDNGGDNLAVSISGNFTFLTKVNSGATYAVTVLTQPATQTCTVASGSGSASANVTNVAVNCVTNTYSISGTVSGLLGSVVLQDNGGDNFTASGSGSFTFPTKINSGTAYAVTVLTQPATQTCTVAAGTGTASANVTNVAVTCTTNTYSIGGTVSGLVGNVVLQDNGGDNYTAGASGSFTFPTKINSGAPYAVTVLTQPATQTCTVAAGTGTASANVTNVAVTCTTNTYSIGGTVSGLVGNLVLQDNGGDNFTASASGSFTFPTKINSGAPYAVTVLTQPATQTCTVAAGTGTASANVTTVAVTCVTNTYTIGGSVAGLTGGTLTLLDNGGDSLNVVGNGPFTFPTKVNSGSTYTVTVGTQPAGQTCSVASGTGTASANVANVAVTCSTTTYSIGGTVSGLSSGTLTLLNNGDSLNLVANGGFTFLTKIASGGGYTVTVGTQPTGQTCVVASGSGTANANVTNVAVTCTVNTYTIGGTVSGLSLGATVVLQDNGGDNLSLSATGAFTFATKIPYAGFYAVTVLTQPAGQFCTVSPSGTFTAFGNVSSISVTCASNSYTVGGQISGLTGTVVLQDNGGDNLSLSSNGAFTFATPVVTGHPYAVTVLTQPAGQTCTATGASGTVNGGPVTGVVVTCVTNATGPFTISGTVNGPQIAGVTITLSGASSGTATTNVSGAYSFANLTGGLSYTVVASLPGYSWNPSVTQPLTLNANTIVNFTAAPSIPGFGISGSVNYAGSKTGRVYVNVSNTNSGTSTVIAGGTGTFAIRGVSNGSYILVAHMDTGGFGNSNAADPTGSSLTVTVSNSSQTGINITLTEPAVVPTPQAPTGIRPFTANGAAVIFYNGQFASGAKGSTEQATSYKLYYGTDAAATNGPGSPITRKADGNSQPFFQSSLTPGASYYYAMSSLVGASESAKSAVVGPFVASASAGLSAVSGAVTFPGTATGPMYVGVYNNTTNALVFTRIANPVSPQNYSVAGVANGTYQAVAIIDMNNDGAISAGDIANVGGNGNPQLTSVAGNTVINQTLNASTPRVTLQTNHATNGTPAQDFYQENVQLKSDTAGKLVVAVEILSAPSGPVPRDLGSGNGGRFQDQFFLGAAPPSIGDVVTLRATYSDGTTQDFSPAVTGVLSSFPQNPAANPTGGNRNMPTFSWTAPASPPSSYTYGIDVYSSLGGNSWNYPTQTNGMPSSQLSVVYNVDGTANPAQLVTGTTYIWNISVQDSNNNNASWQSSYTP